MQQVKTFAVALPLMVLGACSSGQQGQFSPEGMQELRGLVADQSAKITELQSSVRQLSGRIEELEHNSATETTEIKSALSRFSSRVPPPQGVPADLLAQDEQRIALNSGPAAQLYRTALLKLREGSFVEAEKVFSQFSAENPGTTFSDNAIFWSAVCFEKLGQSDRAIVQFSQVFQRFPKEDYAPAALFRLGQAFQTIGSKDDARTTYQKLVADYPTSSWAQLGRGLLGELKGR